MKQDKSAELLSEVRRQMGDGKFSRAFATLKDLLASNPSHQEGRRLLATLLLKFGNLATAKNAFETLVKEALHRRDYSEVESLLREYLVAGPRCVAFIEMLGATYEAKGDPLGAVFEYEKAIDILLEDPDPARPTFAQDLFEKIKQLAPSSFVANRVAARLQHTTAQPSTPILAAAPDELDDAGREVEVAATVSSEAAEETGVEAERDVHDSEGEEEAKADAEADELECSSDIHQQPVIQSSAAQAIPPARLELDEKVPFPPVNHISEHQLSTKNDVVDEDKLEWEPESDGIGFGSEPICEPSRVKLYSEESEVALSGSDAALRGSKAKRVPEEGQSNEPAKRDGIKSTNGAYWERVLGGPTSIVSHEGAPSVPADVEEGAPMDLDRSKPRRRYGRDFARWLSYRLRIIIRRLIATTNSFTKLAVFVSLAIVAWVVLITGGAASLWFGLEQKPSETFQRVINIVPSKSVEDWKHNGYILLIGFGAAPSMDPMQVGYDRWLSVATESSHGCPDRMAKARSVAHQQPADWLKAPDLSAQFAVEGARVKEDIDPQGQLGSRYRRWLNLSFDDWGFNRLGSPDCAQILAVHRLYVAEGFTQTFNAGLDRLETDFTAWRKVLAQAKTLSMKAMAADAINDDLAVMSGLLNRANIDNKVVQRLTRMARPLDPEEKSLRWPMQNEFALAVKRMETRVRLHADSDPSLAVVVAKMSLPKQRTLNMYAAYYDVLIKAAGSPHSPTPKLYDFANTPSRTWLDYLFNPIDNLIGADPTPDWDAIIGTIMKTDARLRLAGLQARLRTPSSDTSLVARIAQAGPNFYDPFTELPMLVNATRGTLYSVGMDHKDDGGDPTFDVSVPFLQ
ncbi:MAG: tetratricopeptide repeat protein [Nitrospirales bacterium]|nr:tetratricopeptide repeat protein [Nitrospirales bacterium]